MSARFADLMALSVSQTAEANLEAKALLEQRKAREEASRARWLEQQKKEKEMKMRRFRYEMEAQQHREEMERKAEEDKRKREEAKLRQEEEQKRALIYGPKAAKANGAGGRANGAARSGPRGKSGRLVSDDELEAGAMALTREEKRQKKLMADLNKGSPTATRKSTTAGSYSKHGKVLKGGAIDATTTNLFSYAPTAATEHLSVKERIAAMPNYLQKLNTVKRDTRTIDEIMRDRQKAREAKVLNGEDAKEFHDWFSSKPKKDPLSAVQKMSSTQPSASSTPTRSLTPNPASSSQPKPATSAASVPPSATKASSNNSARPSQRISPRPEVTASQPKTKITLVKPQQASSSPFAKVPPKSSTPAPAPKSSSQPIKPSTSASVYTARSHSRPRAQSTSVKKRSLSESLDDDSEFESRSPSPAYKRRAISTSGKNDISSQIWQMFGKDRSRYMKTDVYSDDEDDMEVDADALRREEMRSARIARKEDEEALREEARHEEEKRRRRKEKEARDRRS